MSYRIDIKASAKKELDKIHSVARGRLARKIDALRDDPYSQGWRKLKGKPDYWRIKLAKYREIYRVEEEVLKVLVVKVGNRDDIDQNLEGLCKQGRVSTGLGLVPFI